MSSTVNQFQIIGYLGNAPALKNLPDGEQVAILQIATQSRWKGLDGSLNEKIDWHTIYAYRRLATTSADFLKKGMLLRVAGSIENWPTPSNPGSSCTYLKAKEIKHLTSNFPVPKGEAIKIEPPAISDSEIFEAAKLESVKKGVSR